MKHFIKTTAIHNIKTATQSTLPATRNSIINSNCRIMKKLGKLEFLMSHLCHINFLGSGTFNTDWLSIEDEEEGAWFQ